MLSIITFSGFKIILSFKNVLYLKRKSPFE